MSYILIELKSDTCVSSGEIYNCLVDSDICYDKYGLPYIPAKRMKGCLRESAEELRDWGYEIEIDEIFGEPGSHNAMLRISNANLCKSDINADYEDYLIDIKAYRNANYITTQSVLEQFAYMRTQTQICNKSGVAKRNTLRSIRVLKRGLTFRANVSFSCNNEIVKDYIKQLEDCCKALKTMGLNRTRGMGEVEVSFHFEEEIEQSQTTLKTAYHRPLPDGEREKLQYVITLKSPLLTRSISAGQDVTENYIEGAKVLGFLVHHVGMGFEEFMNLGELICSNAYIYNNGIRYLPASAALYSLKNNSGSIRDRVVDDSIQEEYKKNLRGKIEQLKSLKDIYVSSNEMNEIHTMEVCTEIRYHHSRPEDKSIGRANAKMYDLDSNSNMGSIGAGEFYQLESLSEGQQFSGYVIGTPAQIELIEKAIRRHSKTRMGYNRSSEYGEVEFELVSAQEEKKDSIMCKQFVLKLESPLIQYSDDGAYTTESFAIIEALKKILNVETLKINKEFVKFKTLCGYNTTWKMRKPVIYAFDKGTTFVIEADCEIDLSLFSDIWLGERVNEGYGEISVYPIGSSYEKVKVNDLKVKVQNEVGVSKYKTNLIPNIANKLEVEYISGIARKKAQEYRNKCKRVDVLKPVVHALWSKLIELSKHGKERILEDTKELLDKKSEKKANSRRAAQKDTISNEILQDAFMEEILQNNIYEAANLTKKEIRYEYYLAYFEELKYLLRIDEIRKGGN
ncbi:RAMP superfamily CRISPR-associated protein [[Clostridium] polysaccharolyticum]|uniref:CRISPR/Cas system CSM-associated protein Csm3, group 7 of RAMP superfamily n=1 Tax=[Clostridium] polysaccharolyticum TaxID=29364 RepID=A0A1I0AUI9_9FIRM|nr:RAMP superfamily CRISPR-associated protein [[Clostridium] polysaccharolyticum]SES98068.1 CRISPR/Cas system CSM-associated protein Csm3, group 7 of RAMP superfamily [[Clostridium] polysaccharolyticum]